MMKTERISLDTLLNPDNARITREIADAIVNGAVFVYPTETIYGIGGNALLDGVKEKIFTAKKRPPENPMILIAAQWESFSSLPLNTPQAALALMKRFWPGLLTLVLPSGSDPAGTAVRVSDHPFIRTIFSFLSVPLFSTSANVSGEAYNPDPDAIFESLKGSIDFMIDAGFLPPSPPSSVVKITSDNTVTCIREGVVSNEKILACLKTAQLH